MILDWFAQSGVFALALAVLFVPGLLVGAALRLRGLLLWAAAPGASAGLLALLAVGYAKIGIRWGLLSVAVGVVVSAAVLFGVRTLIRRGPAAPPRRGGGAGLLLGGGLLVGGLLNAARLMTYVGEPAAISQTNDAVFHLNALRWIAETGSASSLDLSGLVGAASFYPAAWHAIASLVALDTAMIPVAANMVALVIAAVAWPLSIAALVHVVTRGDAAATALSAALSAALLAFPQLMFEWGVLYPYALSLAVVPAAVAGTIVMVRTWRDTATERVRRTAPSALLVLVLVAGIALAQPASLLAWGVWVMLWFTSELVLDRQVTPALRWTLIGLGWAAIAVVWAVLTYLAGPVLWRAYRGVLGAVGDVALQGHSLLPAAPIVSILLLLGIVAAWRAAHLRWLILAWAGLSVLYVVAVATDLPVVKRLLTGPWYGDSFRLTAMVPLAVVPLAAVGTAAVLRWAAARRARTRPSPERSPVLVVVAAFGIIGAIGVLIAPVVPLRVAAETDEQSRYTLNDRSYLSADEYALLRMLPDEIPADAVLIANPSTGAAFAYVLGQRDIIPRTWSPPQSQAWDVLAAGMHGAADDPAVCEALAAYGSPEYVLDFGIGGTGPGEYEMPGMTGFAGREGFELVAAEGDAELWRITACD